MELNHLPPCFVYLIVEVVLNLIRKMGVEKEGVRNGSGHVGGFFQLFDWSSKSQKKLFSSKSELPGKF